jgi:hypothetical protein
MADTPRGISIEFGAYPVYPVSPITVMTGLTHNDTPFKTSGHLCGYGVRNTSTSNSVVLTFYDGLDANGQRMLDMSINPSESVRDWFGFMGIQFRTGLFVVTTGYTLNLDVWWRP